MSDPLPDPKLRAGRSYAHRWALLLPFLWQIGLAPFVNDVAARPYGLPFPMLWQMLGIIVATLSIGFVYVIDSRREADEAGEEP